MSAEKPPQPWVGICACGKRIYPSRKVARRAAKAMHPGDHLRAYRCKRKGKWHIGHLRRQATEEAR